MIRRIVACAAACLAAAVLVTGCTSSSPGKPKPSQLNDQNRSGPYMGAGLDPAQPRPSFTLTDSAGQPFSFGTVTAGHPTLLYFGYTNCPDICPATMSDIRQALSKQPATLQKSTYVVFVSTDVKHDTGPVIARWLANFSPGTQAHWVGLHGTQAEIDAAQAASRITLAEDDGQTHSALVLLFGPDDYARVEYPESDQETQEIAHDLPLIATGSHS